MEKQTQHKHQWAQSLKILKANTTAQEYDKLYAPMAFSHLDDERQLVYLHVPSNYIVEKLSADRRLRSLLYNALWLAFKNENLGIRYRVLADSTTGATTDIASNVGSISEAKINARTKKVEPSEQSDFDSRLNEEYTFETFVEGKGNILLRTTGMDITKDTDDYKFNPFFIHGAPGVGKTHLANAIGIQFKRTTKKKVLYVTAQELKQQYMQATSQENHYNDFIYFYQSIDVLIIDDIQEIAGVKGTLAAIFVIIRHLIDNRKRIIITCDQDPQTLPGIDERLRTRFYLGLCAPMERPDQELCRKILESKIARDGLQISEEVIDFIAQHTIYNVRELEGIISSLYAYSLAYKRDIDLSIARQVLSHTNKMQKKAVTVDLILETLCRYFDVTQEEIMSSSRKAEIVKVRQLAMYLASQLTKHPITKIGLYIGKRNHSTVLHGIKNIKDRLSLDADFQQQVKDIEEDLKH